MTTPPQNDVIVANQNGFELRELEDFWDILADSQQILRNQGDLEGVERLKDTGLRVAMLLKYVVPHARYILWKREEKYVVVSPTLESFRAEYPWLRHEKVIK